MQKEQNIKQTTRDEVDINLISDLESLFNKEMLEMGCQAKKEGYDLLDYFKVKRRLTVSKPRKIYYSKEFICPDGYHRALNQLILEVKNGGNLLPYMSKSTISPSENDGLLNDWNIHHFHLNEDYEKDSIFVKRSDWLLLAFVTEESLYCLNVYSHGEPYLWIHQELLKVLDRNWPELIEKYRLKDVTGSGEKLDDEEYWNLRKANMTMLADLSEGKVYGLIGGGYASDGSSLLAVEAADDWYSYLWSVEQVIRDEQQLLIQKMLYYDELSLEKKVEVVLLTVTDKNLILLEKQRNIIINVSHTDGRMILLCNMIRE